MGTDLQLTSVIRGVLRAYSTAASEDQAQMPGAQPNMRTLMLLNDKILNEQVQLSLIQRAKVRPAQPDPGMGSQTAAARSPAKAISAWNRRTS